MKFEYDVKSDDRECVAAIYEFDGGPELCLAVKAQCGKMVWFYHSDGLASVQDGGFPPYDVVKKFYPGDKLTITF
jgi:hypothetical protein